MLQNRLIFLVRGVYYTPMLADDSAFKYLQSEIEMRTAATYSLIWRSSSTAYTLLRGVLLVSSFEIESKIRRKSIRAKPPNSLSGTLPTAAQLPGFEAHCSSDSSSSGVSLSNFWASMDGRGVTAYLAYWRTA